MSGPNDLADRARVEAFAPSLRGTGSSTSYGRPAVKVGDRTFVSNSREVGSFHIRSPHDEKMVLLETDPENFWQTSHDANWPGLLVRHGPADPERVRLVVTRAWWDAARPALRKDYGHRP